MFNRCSKTQQVLTYSLLGAVTLGLWSCQDSTTNYESETLETAIKSQPLTLGTTYLLPSTLYGEAREINVYVPNIPDWGKGYFDTPLSALYVIDGGRDQDFIHIAALSQLTLINAERQPMIVVGIRTHNRRAEITPEATDPRYTVGEFEGYGGSETFRRHIAEEVKPFINGKFETGRNVIIGESLAGLFVVETFLQTPELFDDYIAISPSMWWDDRKLSKNAGKHLDAHKAAGRRLYLTMGDEGGTMRLGLDELLAQLDKRKDIVDTRFVDRAKTDSHASIYHHSARDALGWMFSIDSPPYGEMPWYLEIGGQPDTEKK